MCGRGHNPTPRYPCDALCPTGCLPANKQLRKGLEYHKKPHLEIQSSEGQTNGDTRCQSDQSFGVSSGYPVCFQSKLDNQGGWVGEIKLICARPRAVPGPEGLDESGSLDEHKLCVSQLQRVRQATRWRHDRTITILVARDVNVSREREAKTRAPTVPNSKQSLLSSTPADRTATAVVASANFLPKRLFLELRTPLRNNLNILAIGTFVPQRVTTWNLVRCTRCTALQP